MFSSNGGPSNPWVIHVSTSSPLGSNRLGFHGHDVVEVCFFALIEVGPIWARLGVGRPGGSADPWMGLLPGAHLLWTLCWVRILVAKIWLIWPPKGVGRPRASANLGSTPFGPNFAWMTDMLALVCVPWVLAWFEYIWSPLWAYQTWYSHLIGWEYISFKYMVNSPTYKYSPTLVEMVNINFYHYVDVYISYVFLQKLTVKIVH